MRKAGAGALGLGALALTPSTANLKLTENGIFGSSTINQELNNVETLNVDSTNANSAKINGRDAAPFLKKGGSRNVYTISSLTVETNGFGTLFSSTSGEDVVFGVVYGANVGNIRLTFDDGTTEQFFSGGGGWDKTGDRFDLGAIPPAKNVKKVEFQNPDGSNNFDYGGMLITV